MNKQQAQTILDQLSKHLVCMTGAHTFLIHEKENGVSFKFKAKSKYNYCKIVLNSLDLYDMTLKKVRVTGTVREEKIDGLYNDMLTKSFEQATGLYLSL